LAGRFAEVRLIKTHGPTEATLATPWIVVDDEVPAQGFTEDDELRIVGLTVMRGYRNRSFSA
jgi:D-alanine--poly(phosphoribitol) ligase subunit 1